MIPKYTSFVPSDASVMQLQFGNFTEENTPQINVEGTNFRWLQHRLRFITSGKYIVRKMYWKSIVLWQIKRFGAESDKLVNDVFTPLFELTVRRREVTYSIQGPGHMAITQPGEDPNSWAQPHISQFPEQGIIAFATRESM